MRSFVVGMLCSALLVWGAGVWWIAWQSQDRLQSFTLLQQTASYLVALQNDIDTTRSFQATTVPTPIHIAGAKALFNRIARYYNDRMVEELATHGEFTFHGQTYYLPGAFDLYK